jgi:uncharacterized protein
LDKNAAYRHADLFHEVAECVLFADVSRQAKKNLLCEHCASNERSGWVVKQMDRSEKKIPFWERKSLAAMTRSEWEALCDGCARCCLHKLEDEETGDVFYTDVACRLLDIQTCRCRSYGERTRHVPACLNLTPARVIAWDWLPESCAYRRLATGKPLYHWHPLVSGDPESVHRTGISIRNRVCPEDRVPADRMVDRIIFLD